MSKTLVTLVLGFILFVSLATHAHLGHHHGSQTHEAKTLVAQADQRRAYADIEAGYVINVRPIFEAKCASCHSVESPSPWYATIPGLHQLIEGDRTEAKKHLEISKGFPFAGHGEPIEDLKAIEDSLNKNTMPPGLFAFMHPSSRLTDDEKKKVLDWAKAGETELTAVSKPKENP